MLPKKIYLIYTNEDNDALTWVECPIICSDGVIKNREYTDLSQVWHDPSEEPVPGRMILVFFASGNLTSWRSVSNIIALFGKHNVLKWSYVDDLLPKGGEIWK